MPGANPAFGLNSLGGALAYTTYDGRSSSGLRGELSGGSFGRGKLSLSYGRSGENGWHQYVAATGFTEDGWRDHSDSDLGQFLGKIGRDDGTTDWTLGLLLGKSKLLGNGLTPAYTFGDDGERVPDLYVNRREAVFTHPDETKNELEQLSFNLQHALDASSSISALAYVRHTKRDTLNGDVADDFDDPQANAVFNTTRTRQTGYGGGLSYARESGAHQWQVGATVDTADVGLPPERAAGLLRRHPRRVALRRWTRPRPRPRSMALPPASASMRPTPGRSLRAPGSPARCATTTRVSATRSARSTTTPTSSRSIRTSASPTTASTRRSASPGAPARRALRRRCSATSRATRACPPSSSWAAQTREEPCRLPAGLQSDPFLEQVKSTTFEAGLRWPLAPGMRFTVEVYRTDNKDDILFQSVDATSQLGYFANFPKTRNQGIDAQLTVTRGPLDMSVGYSYLKATYEATATLRQGERNVTVTPGTRIAGLPRHTFKLSADWRFGEGWSVGGDMLAVSNRGVLGNEDGLLEDPEPGEEPQEANLDIPGYAIFNLRASWKPAKDWEFYFAVNNVFDRRYETFGALAETVFTPTGEFAGDESDAVFVAPGAPRSFWAGLRYRF